MKTYCISDVHGHLDNLLQFINTLNEDDRVYVLGDVIDKGDEPIEALKIIMHDNRFTMLLGNHEYMMYQYLSSAPGSFERMDKAELWLDWNSGYDTYDKYLNLSDIEKKEVFDYIENLPLNIVDLNVEGKKYYLVHSCPVDSEQVRMADLDYNENKIGAYVWQRVTPYDKLNIGDCTVIAGHTAVIEYIGQDDDVYPVSNTKELKDAKYIDIDGGLAYSLDNSRLIVLCLDDLSYQLF